MHCHIFVAFNLEKEHEKGLQSNYGVFAFSTFQFEEFCTASIALWFATFTCPWMNGFQPSSNCLVEIPNSNTIFQLSKDGCC